MSPTRADDGLSEVRAGRAPAVASGGSPSREGGRVKTNHRSAVAKTLSWADEAAAESDYGAALFLLSVVQASGSRLQPDYLQKQHDWTLAALASHRS